MTRIVWLIPVAALSLDAAQSAAQQERSARLSQAHKHYEAGRYKEAEGILLDALKRWPGFAATNKNLALVYLKLGEDVRARAQLEQYVAKDPTAYDRAWAQDEIRACEERIARRPVEVKATSTPPGADVLLDDAASPAGKTPFVTSLAPGKYLLRLRLAGRADVLQAITVEPRRPLTVHVPFPKPEPAKGVLTIEAVAGARVFVDRKPGRIGDNTLAPGVHQVRVEMDGHAAWEKEIELHPGETRVAAARLTPLPPAAERATALLTRPADTPSTRPQPPIWKRWWFWSAIGASLMAGVVTTVYLTRRQTVELVVSGLSATGRY